MTPDTPSSSMTGLSPPGPPVRDPVRWVIYTHLVSVIYCTIHSLAGSGLLINDQISQLFNPTAEYPVILGLIALPCCPLFLIAVLIKNPISKRVTVTALVAEALLCLAHVFVLLPAVQ